MVPVFFTAMQIHEDQKHLPRLQQFATYYHCIVLTQNFKRYACQSVHFKINMNYVNGADVMQSHVTGVKSNF